MYGQMNPDLPNQLYSELVRAADQERLARRIIRDRKEARRLARRDRRATQPWAIAVTEPNTAA